MSRTIFFLAKIFDNEKYAADFVGGKLFLNRLSYFRELEDGPASNRGDKHEAIVGWHQPDQIQITINGMPLVDLAAPVSIQMDGHGHLNVFCIYAAHSGDFEALTNENIEDFKKQLQIPDGCLQLGQYVVLVTNVQQFSDRVKAAARKSKFRLKVGLVQYYDPNTFSGSISEEESVFRKRAEYQHQRECRFSIDTGTQGSDPIVLDIGDISDITMRCLASEVNSYLDIKLPEGGSA